MSPTPFEELRDSIKRGDSIALRAFLENGGDPNLQNAAGETPLSVAASAGQTLIAELMLHAGAEVNLHAHGFTPLYLASINGHERTVQLLLKHGADPDIPVSGQPISYWLSLHGSQYQRIVELLATNRTSQ